MSSDPTADARRHALCLDRASAVADGSGRWWPRPIERFRTNSDGKTSDVYPALADVPQDLFGLCVAGTSGAIYASGDWDARSRS